MRVLLTGGGTGGHIYPALAVAKGLSREYPELELLYVGTKRGLENSIVPQAGLPFAAITVEGLPRKVGPALFKAGLKAVEGGFEALKLLKDFKPDLVVGTGGYVCGPVILAAKLQGIPSYIHEQNALPGLTNKLLARVADGVMINFEDAKKFFAHPERVTNTGLPIRPDVFLTTKVQGLDFFGLDHDKITLLVSGGSQGAKSINKAVVGTYPQLLQHKHLQIIHLTGAADYDNTLAQLKGHGIVLEKYPQLVIRPYLHEMAYALAAADICIGRAGATYLAEITACGLPSVLIPYPFASENHQQYNAQALVDRKAAMMLLDKALTEVSLYQTLEPLIDDEVFRRQMAQNALQSGNRDALDNIITLLKPYLENKHGARVE